MAAIQPVHLNDQGPKVATLHKGLRSLIREQPGISDGDRAMLQQRLAPEVSAKRFGDVTAEVVGTWQAQLRSRPGLPPALKSTVMTLPFSNTTGRGNGDVDQITAEALNWLLEELGADV
jgi:hypothetical protein